MSSELEQQWPPELTADQLFEEIAASLRYEYMAPHNRHKTINGEARRLTSLALRVSASAHDRQRDEVAYKRLMEAVGEDEPTQASAKEVAKYGEGWIDEIAMRRNATRATLRAAIEQVLGGEDE